MTTISSIDHGKAARRPERTWQTNVALSQANAKYQQNTANLASAQTALQVAEDFLSSEQG
jgi:hypothetical protein